MRAKVLPAFTGRKLPKFITKLQRGKWLVASAVTSGTMIIMPLANVSIAHAQSDITAPQLSSATMVSPVSQDISTPAGALVIVNVTAQDNLSGMAAATSLVYTSPSGRQTNSGNIQSSPDTTSPNQWRFEVSMPQYSETGTWTPTITMIDAAGNQQVWGNNDLLAKGWDLRTTLTGVSDTTPPDIAGITMNTPNTADSSTTTHIQLTIIPIETQSGFSSLSTLTYTSPSGKQTTGGTILPDGSGNLIAPADIVPYSESGTWTPSITLIDAVGNKAVFTNSDLLARGMDLHVNVSGPSDTTPPSVSNLKFVLSSPIVDDVPYGGAVISVGGNITDNMSGVANAHLQYTSANGQTADGDMTMQPNGTYLTNLQLPSYAESGFWQPHLTLTDGAGNVASLDSTALKNLGYDLSFGVTKNITRTAAPGETVTSDEEGDGATVSDPVEASVTTPSGGNVSIVVVASNSITDATNGYTFFDRQISISAPQESASNPLTLNFLIDSSKVPAGQNQNTLQVTRNGTAIPPCTDAITAAPDPCVFSRQLLSDGDISVSIHSTSASIWSSGFPTQQVAPPSKYHFSGFSAPVAKTGLTKVNAGSAVPLHFSLGGKFGTGILANDYPQVTQINCSTEAAISTSVAATDSAKRGLLYVSDRYQYDWKTSRDWGNTCRRISFKLDDGTTFAASFKF